MLEILEMITIACLSVIDVSLTYVQVLMVEKKCGGGFKLEENPIAKFIMKKLTFPYNYFLSIILFPLLCIGVVSFASYFSTQDTKLIPLSVFTGIFITINLYHIVYIKGYIKNWNNEKYWEIAKQVNEAKL